MVGRRSNFRKSKLTWKIVRRKNIALIIVEEFHSDERTGEKKPLVPLMLRPRAIPSEFPPTPRWPSPLPRLRVYAGAGTATHYYFKQT